MVVTHARINRNGAANCYMWRKMIWSWIKGGLTHAVLALAALAFFVGPTADAAVCAPEPAAAISSMHASDMAGGHAAQTDQAPDSGDGHAGEACLHGHCHHQGQAVAAPVGAIAVTPSVLAATGFLIAERDPPGVDQPLLQRPPRV
jgi:hypothetical protein